MKKLISLVAILLMATNMVQAQDSIFLAQAYKDSVYKATVATNRAERKAARLFEASQPWKTRFVVGANLVIEAQGSLFSGGFGHVAPDFGASFEAQFTRHSGLETGLYYRNIKFREGFVSNHHGEPVPVPQTNARYLSLPIMYKFYSRILNFSVGLSFDYLIAHTTHAYTHYVPDKLILGVATKVSKEFVLVDNLIIELSFNFNPYISMNDLKKLKEMTDTISGSAWLGGSIGLKYRF